MKYLTILALSAIVFGAKAGNAAEITVAVRAIATEGGDELIGTVVFQDTSKGLKIYPNLRGLDKGRHGFHIHESADCGAERQDGVLVVGLAAGGHFDPEETGKHEGPKGSGHLGDLPVLHVGDEGQAKRTSFAPRLKTSDLLGGRSVVIHAGADNYADRPKPQGGGGARVACGVIEHY